MESADSWHVSVQRFECGVHVVGMQREMDGCVDVHACISYLGGMDTCTRVWRVCVWRACGWHAERRVDALTSVHALV